MFRFVKRLAGLYRHRTQEVEKNMFDEIIPNLYLGDEQDAKHCGVTKPFLFVDARAFFNTLSGDADVSELMVIPQMAIAQACAKLVDTGIYVMVYCQAGMERSPFLVALILNQMGRGTLQECYDFVKQKHPQTIQYSKWVEGFEYTWNRIRKGV